LGIAVDAVGDLYIADSSRVRKVSNAVITTAAGNGLVGDNGPAIGAQLDSPYGAAVDSAGNLYVAEYYPERIREVSGGLIQTVAGVLFGPEGVAVDLEGSLYIADTFDNRIRKVTNGVITTVAGNGIPGFSGDNGAATSAQLNMPDGVAVDAVGNLYIADFKTRMIVEPVPSVHEFCAVVNMLPA
jgi:trimeric autotransporter adhesin